MRDQSVGLRFLTPQVDILNNQKHKKKFNVGIDFKIIEDTEFNGAAKEGTQIQVGMLGQTGNEHSKIFSDMCVMGINFN